MNVLVIGGTLFIGARLVTRLAKAGHDVTVLHRKPDHALGPEVQSLVADRNDADAVRRAVHGRGFEAVFDNVYDWERGTTADAVEAAARACGDRLRRYVFLSSVAAYGDGLDHTEEDLLAADDHPEAYVRNKAMSERALFRLHRESGFPAVTLRPPFVYGPGNPFYREAFFWDRLRDGRPILLPGDGSRLMQFVHVDDVVSAALLALERPAAAGQAFNIANPRPVTQREAVEAFARAAGLVARQIPVPRERILAAGGHPMGPKLYFGVYFDLPPITMRIDKAREMLGFVPTDFYAGLTETYSWYRRKDSGVSPDYNFNFEDSLLTSE